MIKETNVSDNVKRGINSWDRGLHLEVEKEVAYGDLFYVDGITDGMLRVTIQIKEDANSDWVDPKTLGYKAFCTAVDLTYFLAFKHRKQEELDAAEKQWKYTIPFEEHKEGIAVYKVEPYAIRFVLGGKEVKVTKPVIGENK